MNTHRQHQVDFALTKVLSLVRNSYVLVNSTDRSVRTLLQLSPGVKVMSSIKKASSIVQG